MPQFSSELLLSNAADQLPTLPKTQSAHAARDRYAVLGFIYYDINITRLSQYYVLEKCCYTVF